MDMLVALRALQAENDSLRERLGEMEAAQKSASELSLILNNVSDVIFAVRVEPDGQFRFASINRRFLEVTGLAEAQVVGLLVQDVIPSASHALVFGKYREAIETGAPVHWEEVSEYPTGTRLGHVTVVPVFHGGVCSALIGLVHDITARKRAEEEKAALELRLHQSQKMEAIGALAGGIAHDFNNILGGLLGELSVLALDLEGAPEQLSKVQDMMALVERGANLAKQLLCLGHRSKQSNKPLDLFLVAEQTGFLFGRTRRDITISYDFQPGLRPVLMEHTQLEQVLLNLFLNAGQAMRGGGQLSLFAENEPSVPGGAGSFVKLVVTDTGIGMGRETLSRIFEPFFTTKIPSQGSGLGLASVYNIIKSYGGQITAESEPTRGSSFRLLLPSVDLPAAVEVRQVEATHQGRGTILIVDDEELLLKPCAELLQRMGYDALAASSGEEALRIIREYGERLSLVILDLTMPEMSGEQTYEALREIAPELKVLLSSGFTLEDQTPEILERGYCGFIQKPFNAAMLAAKLNSLLNTAPPASSE